MLFGPQLTSLAPSSPRYVRPRLPSLFPPRPSRSIPALTVAAGGGLRAQRAVARHAGPQVVFAHDPQRPALEGPQQQHLLPLLQHAGGVAPHRGREAAGGRRRRGRGLRPAPRAWSGRQRLLRSRYRERSSQQGGGSAQPSPGPTCAFDSSLCLSCPRAGKKSVDKLFTQRISGCDGRMWQLV